MLVREDQAYPDFKVRHALRAASFCYPNWDTSRASSLLEDFRLRPGKAIKSLSRGQRSALGITIGLAARAEVTLFDEPTVNIAIARDCWLMGPPERTPSLPPLVAPRDNLDSDRDVAAVVVCPRLRALLDEEEGRHG